MPIDFIVINCKCGEKHKVAIGTIGTIELRCYACGAKFDSDKYKKIKETLLEVKVKLAELEAKGGYLEPDKMVFFE